MCDKYGVQAIYVTMPGVLLHMYVLCEEPKITASGTSHLCVCVCACARVWCVHVCVHVVCVCVCVCMCVHSCTCMICENSVRNKNPKSLQAVQAQSVCVYVCCVYMCVCTCTLCKNSEKYEPKVTASGTSPVCVSVRNKNPKSLQVVQVQSV